MGPTLARSFASICICSFLKYISNGHELYIRVLATHQGSPSSMQV